jgi:hypothetical protein
MAEIVEIVKLGRMVNEEKKPWRFTLEYDTGFRIYFDDGTAIEIMINKGSTWDGASVPRIFWSYTGPRGKNSWAALLHDILMETHILDFDTTSKAFRRLLSDSGRGWFKRNVMYVFVSNLWIKYKVWPKSEQHIAEYMKFVKYVNKIDRD